MRRVSFLVPTFLCTAALAATTACGPGAGTGDDDDDDDTQIDAGFDPDGTTATEECRKMDLIFVIDDSGSMSQEQDNLASNFPEFANLLNAYTISTGETLDYRAAVTTTGITANITVQPPMIPGLPPFPPFPQNQVGQDGRFVVPSACSMPRPWLERTDPNMAETFACAADVGTGGPAYEMPLRASQLAAMAATNPGFLRSDALLGIVILTDEDDCSRTDSPFTIATDDCVGNGGPNLQMPQEIVQALDQVKGDRGRWAAAIIAGRTSCTSSFGSAAEGVRLKQFQQAAGSNVVFGDICSGDLAPALQQALETFQAACENFPPIGREVPVSLPRAETASETW